MDDFNYGIYDKLNLDREIMVSNYIKNWSFFMMSYKEFTVFGNVEGNEAARNMRLGRRFLGILELSFNKIVQEIKSYGVGKLISLIVEKIMLMIPFVGSIPFLSTILTKIITYIVSFIINIIVEFIEEKVDEGITLVTQGCARLFEALKPKPFFELNYRKYVNEEEDVPDDAEAGAKGSMKADIRELENLYFDNLMKAEITEKFLNNYRIFDPLNNTLDVRRIKNPIILQDVQQLADNLNLNPKDRAAFAEQKEKIKNLEQEIEEITDNSDFRRKLLDKKIKKTKKESLLMV